MRAAAACVSKSRAAGARPLAPTPLAATTRPPPRRAVASDRPHAYVRCTRSSKLRGTLSAILSQLAAGGGPGGGKRKRAAGYAAPTGSEATLIADLQALCGPDAAPRSDQTAADQQSRQRLVILDDVQHLLMGDDAAARPGDGAPVLRGLLQVSRRYY